MGRRLRSTLVAATWPLRRLAWAFEDGVLWRGRELAGAAVDAVRWHFERLAWSFEERLLWPLQERAAGWAPSRPAPGAATLGALGAVAVLLGVGVLALSAGEAPRERVAAPARVAIAPPPPPPQEQEEPRGPALRGAPPSFGVGKAAGVAESEAGGTGGVQAEGSGAESEAAAEAAGATASSRKPVPAGPVAMKVARRFSEAFLFYEIGERPGRAKTVFGETATPRLAKALSERPPRQPESAEVPQARVVNLVPGPRAGKAYTVSVSLLRLGLTSELRLRLRKKSGAWVVTDVRG